MSMAELLTAQEVAAMLKVKVTTVRRWYREGKLRGARVGRALRFRRDEVERWLAEKFPAEGQRRLGL